MSKCCSLELEVGQRPATLLVGGVALELQVGQPSLTLHVCSWPEPSAPCVLVPITHNGIPVTHNGIPVMHCLYGSSEPEIDWLLELDGDWLELDGELTFEP